MRPDARIVWATKGLEAETGRLLQDVAREALGDAIPLAVISGPTFAKELAAGLPTAISLASTDQAFSDDLQQLLHCGKSFRVYSNPDFIGVQLGGAVKNVIAIGAGMSDGIGFGANARTALITRADRNVPPGRSAGCRSGHLYGDGWPGRSGADLYRQPVS
jgi:glycerol-3-phosphate dehydrogenase (NAD(P)+)